MFLFHKQAEDTKSHATHTTAGTDQSSFLSTPSSDRATTCCLSMLSHTHTHSLTCCFTSCAKVNHIYTLKFHLRFRAHLVKHKHTTLHTHSYTHTNTQRPWETFRPGTDLMISVVFTVNHQRAVLYTWQIPNTTTHFKPHMSRPRPTGPSGADHDTNGVG